MVQIILITLALSFPAYADCPAPPIGNANDMVVSFMATHGTQAAAAGIMPSTVKEGMLVYDSSADTLKLCDGTTWHPISMGTASDPRIGTLNAGKWCASDGTIINCTSDAPATVVGADKQVIFNDGNTALAGALYLIWDKAANRLGVGTTSPATTLDVNGGTNLRATGPNAADGVIVHTHGSAPYQGGLFMTNSINFSSGASGLYAYKFGTAFTGAAANAMLRIGLVSADAPTTYLNDLLVLRNSQVGINTAAPVSPLHVVGGLIRGQADATAAGLITDTFGTGITSQVILRTARGSTAAPAPLQTGDTLGYIGFRTAPNLTGADIAAYAAENQSSTALGTSLVFRTVAVGGTLVSERLRIAPNGNIGINTAIPAARLDVRGTQTTTYPTSKAEMLANAVAILRPHASNSTNLSISTVADGSAVALQVSNALGTANWPLVLNPFGGWVGIGTAMPEVSLDVTGQIKSNNNSALGGALFLSGRNAAATDIKNRRWGIYSMNEYGAGSLTGLSFWEYADADDDGSFCAPDPGTCGSRVTFAAGGNVGIGTHAPTARLHVYNNAYASALVEGGSATGNHYADYGMKRGNEWWWWSHRAADGLRLIRSGDNGTTYETPLTVLPSGNVGINTVSPQSALHVNGIIRATQLCDQSGANCRLLSDPGSSGPLRESWIRGAYNWSSDPHAFGAWNATHKGMARTGSLTWTGPLMPVNPGQNWHMVVRIKNIGAVNSIFYAGVDSFDHDGNRLSTDAMTSYNYHVASNATLAPGTTHTFSATFGGWNPVGGSGPGFDPEASYFRPIMLLNYTTPGASVAVQGISIFPVP